MRDKTARGARLGLIGGLGVGATTFYYQELVRAHQLRGCVPDLTIIHADVDQVLRWVNAGNVISLAQYLAEFMDRLARAGAQLTAITGIAPYICATELAKLGRPPLVNSIEEINKCIQRRGLRRVAIFGTRYVIETQLFGLLSGVEVIRPRRDEVDLIHGWYMQIVSSPNQAKELRDNFNEIGSILCKRDELDAIVLAGTELSLALDANLPEFPVIDGARVHIQEIMRRLFE